MQVDRVEWGCVTKIFVGNVAYIIYGPPFSETAHKVAVFVDDLVGLGKTVISLPKNVLNKQELEKYIEEIKKKNVQAGGDQQ